MYVITRSSVFLFKRESIRSKAAYYRTGEMIQNFLHFQRTPVLFLVPMLDDSQPAITPALGNLKSSSIL